MKKIIGGMLSLCLLATWSLTTSTYAADTFNVIPESKSNDVGGDVAGVTAGTGKGSVRDKYNAQAQKYSNAKKGSDVGSMFATGIFTRDGVLDYVVYAIRFLSQIALVIGAAMIIVNGYKYAAASFSGKDPGMGDIKNAVFGVLVVIFSYAIIKALSAAFL